MIVLSQLAWSATGDLRGLRHKIAAARAMALARQLVDEPVLVLLPIATLQTQKAPGAAVVSKKIAALAKKLDVYLAGAARVRDGKGPDKMLGFLFTNDGRRALWVAKSTPSLTAGFADHAVATSAEAEFPVVRTPHGQIGLLVGEDIHFPQYARALAFHGAEIILNPSHEVADDHLDIRQRSRMGRATENCAYVAMSSPRQSAAKNTSLAGPAATALYGLTGTVVAAQGAEDFIFPDLDLQALRRARVNPHRSFPALVRANVYGQLYAHAAANKKTTRSPSTAAQWRSEAQSRLSAAARANSSSSAKLEEQYEALLVQHCARLIPLDRAVDATEIINKNLDEALALAGSRANLPSVRLVVFPEFWLTGPGGIGAVQRTVADMERVAIRYPGPVFDRIGQFAQQHRVYVAFQNFEVHDKLPHRVFNSAFLLDDTGKLVHTYRKNQCADVWGLLPDTTPGSIWRKYLDVFGEAALFPVANTPLGRIANMICFDNMIPEVAHGLRQAGAEIILHSSSEPHGSGGREVWDNCRRLRAFENTCYVLSAIDGGEHLTHDSETLTFFRRGHTRIIRFDGNIDGTVDGPGPVAFRVAIDLAALRRARANPRLNWALWDDPAAYARHYAGDVGLPNDLWAGDPNANPYLGAAALKSRIASYLERGVYLAPAEQRARDSLPDSV